MEIGGKIVLILFASTPVAMIVMMLCSPTDDDVGFIRGSVIWLCGLVFAGLIGSTLVATIIEIVRA